MILSNSKASLLPVSIFESESPNPWLFKQEIRISNARMIVWASNRVVLASNAEVVKRIIMPTYNITIT